MVVFSAWFAIYGLPLAAKFAAGFVPLDLEAKLGNQTLVSIDASLCAPSKLDTERQQSLHASFGVLTAGLDNDYRYRLELRACGRIGPNALLSRGSDRVTDELVELAQSPDNLVLTHEIGHVRYRHGLVKRCRRPARRADQHSPGRPQTSPPSLCRRSCCGVPREFEEEADSYAFQRLKEIGLSPRDLAEIPYATRRTSSKQTRRRRPWRARVGLSPRPIHTARRIQRPGGQ